MKILLDTHSLFWFIENEPALTAVACQAIGNPDHEVLISPASYWEIAIKSSLGKWQIPRGYNAFLETAFKTYDFKVLPISPAHTSKLLDMPFHHKDPFDRLLIAQALVEHVPIVSADIQLDAYGVRRIWS